MHIREEAEEAEEEEEENRKSKDHLNFCFFSANVHNCLTCHLFNDNTAQKTSIEFATSLSSTIKSQLRMLFSLWFYSFDFKEELSGKPTDFDETTSFMMKISLTRFSRDQKLISELERCCSVHTLLVENFQ